MESSPRDVYGKYADMLMRSLVEFGDHIFDAILEALPAIVGQDTDVQVAAGKVEDLRHQTIEGLRNHIDKNE